MPDTPMIIDLLPSETGYDSDMLAGDQTGVMLASIYQGSGKEVFQKLDARIHEILTKNKWMMGRLMHVKTPTTNNKKILKAVVDEKFCNIKDYIIKDTDDSFFEEPFKYSRICGKLNSKKYTVLNAKTLWDKDEKYFKAGVIKNKDENKFCLFIVGNHIMFDGTTLYHVWKMLDFKTEVFEISPVRVQDFEERMKNELSVLPQGMDLRDYYKKVFGAYIPAVVRKGIAQKWKGCKLQQHLLKFDMDEIKRVKSKYTNKETGDFVSTNDVLVSWMREVVPKASNIMMAINLRERIESVKMTDGGNYLAAPMLDNADLETPLTVRNWLKKRLVPGNETKVVTYDDFKKYSGGVNTNWSTFYHHVETDGWKQVCHFPVLNMEGQGIGPFPIGTEMHSINFVCGRSEEGVNQVAGYVITRRKELTMEFFEKNHLVKEKMMKV